MSGLVERLKKANTHSVQRSLGSDILLEAASEIEALKAQVDSQQLCLAEIQGVAADPSAVTQHFSQICMIRNMAKNFNSDNWRNTFGRIKAEAVEAAIADYKAEYMGQGVVVLLQSFADKLRTGE